MKLHKKILIEAVTSNERDRPALAEPYLDVEKQRIVATNGRTLAIVPVVVDEGDTSGYVSAHCLREARKAAKGKEHIVMGLAVECVIGGQSAIIERDGDGRLPAGKPYPSVDQVIPNPKENDCMIAIDAQQLWMLAQAIGTKGVVLRFNSAELTAITVSPCLNTKFNGSFPPADRSARGYLMPVQPE